MRFRARVRDGRIVVDEPTNLPDGTEFDLVSVEDGPDDIDPRDAEPSDLTEEEERGIIHAMDQIERGEVVSYKDVRKEMDEFIASLPK
jgi:hypothetical protein